MPTLSSAPEPQSVDWRWRVTAVLGVSLPLFVWLVRMAPLAQDPAYHDFADQRRLLGVPHFWNVMSNLPFAVIGLLGCWWLIQAAKKSTAAFAEPAERVAYFVFFLGEFLTCFGSAYYHSQPSNQTLVWDRLVFSLMLTSFFAILVTEFISLRAGKLGLAPMVLLGLWSVLYWSWSESVGDGDLRLYFLVQFYPVIATPLIMLLFRSRYTQGGALLLTWAVFVLAKACEHYDPAIYALTGFWSGHTFKHFVAAGATLVPLYARRHRSLQAPLPPFRVGAIECVQAEKGIPC
jgi:hypothetical protein